MDSKHICMPIFNIITENSNNDLLYKHKIIQKLTNMKFFTFVLAKHNNFSLTKPSLQTNWIGYEKPGNAS